MSAKQKGKCGVGLCALNFAPRKWSVLQTKQPIQLNMHKRVSIGTVPIASSKLKSL